MATITVPDVGRNPVTIILAGVSYQLGAGETITVPDAVAEELFRMIAAGTVRAPAVDVPWTDAAVTAELSAIKTRLAAVEALAHAKAVPDVPGDDGVYALQVAVEDGSCTLSWEAVEAVSDGGT